MEFADSVDEEAIPLKPHFKRDPRELERWLHRVALRDEHAFELLYAATAPKLFAIALRIVQASGVAEDVLQDSFVTVWTHASSYRSDLSSPMTWMIAIVRHRALDAIRSPERKYVTHADEIPDVADTSANSPEDRYQAVLTSRLLRELRAPQRHAICFAFFHGLTHNEIASTMQVPIGTVKTWIRRGLATMRT
jgi:RNA polymerase sigma-70 factor, ECF subfamily